MLPCLCSRQYRFMSPLLLFPTSSLCQPVVASIRISCIIFESFKSHWLWYSSILCSPGILVLCLLPVPCSQTSPESKHPELHRNRAPFAISEVLIYGLVILDSLSSLASRKTSIPTAVIQINASYPCSVWMSFHAIKRVCRRASAPDPPPDP